MPYNQARHSDGFSVAASPPFRSRACCLALANQQETLVEYFEFGSVTYCTNVSGGTYPSDEEAMFAAKQVSEAFQKKLGSSPYSNEISVTRVEYGVGCILTTITLGATVGALFKFIKDYPKFRPGLILLLKDLNGLYVKLNGTEDKGSTYLMRDDIPEPKYLEMIAEESKAGKRKPVKKASDIKRSVPGKALWRKHPMPEQVDDSGEDTCAGRPIRSAMHPFSVELLAGCRKFSDLAHETDDGQEVMIYATSCIVNAACFLEAKLNEEIAIARACFDEGSDERKRWDEVKESVRRDSVCKKWNQVAALTGGCRWDSGIDPFQSFGTISSLRNELVHFKGDLLGKDEAPSRRIGSLMWQLGVKSKATWIEDDCSSWITDLLSEKSVVRWVSEKITLFDEQYYALIHGRS